MCQIFHKQLLIRTLLFVWAMVFAIAAKAQEGNFIIQFSRGTAGTRTVGSTGNNNSLHVEAYSYYGGDNSSRQWHWEGNYLLNSEGLYIGFNGTNFIGVNDIANACEMEGYFDSNENYKLKRKGANAVMSYGNDNNLIEDSDMEAVKNIIALIQRTGNVGPGGGTIVTPTIDTTASDPFYIRFTNRNTVAWNAYRVVTDNGVGNQLTMTLRGNNANTDTDVAKKQLWTWVGRKYLRNLQGNYIYLDGTTFKTTANRAQASIFRIYYSERARPKLRVVNADNSDSQYIMRAQTVNTTGSAVIASTDLAALDDELELADYEPTTGQKYFIRFMVSTYSRFIHEMGCPGMTETYNNQNPLLCVSSGTTKNGVCIYTTNLRSMTWTMEQSGTDSYRIKSGNGLYMGKPVGNNYSVVSSEADAGNFVIRTRDADHLLTLTDEDKREASFRCTANQSSYLTSVALANFNTNNNNSYNSMLDFVRNDDPLPQDVPTMQDGKWYILKFAGVEQTLIKAHVDANGYYLLEHDKGRYVCRKNDGSLGYTTDISQAAQFEVRAERTGWHLECRNGDTPNVKVTVANGDAFSEVYQYRNANNNNNADTWFSFEEADVPDDIEAARPTMDCDGWYELYFQDVPICARKAECDGFDAAGNRIYKLKYGTQYIKDHPASENATRNKYVTTEDPDQAARFTITLGLGGWQLTRLNDDSYFYGGYTIATKPTGNNRTITFYEYKNKPTSYFGIEKIPSDLEDGKKYVFYFDNMLLYGMYDLEMESGKDCNLVGNPANYGGMAWTAQEPIAGSEGDDVFYYRFQNEFGRYIAWNAIAKCYQVTSDPDKASRFTLVDGDYGYMLKRLDTSTVLIPGNNNTFTEKAIATLTDNEKHLAAIYFREITSNDAWFDDSTEDFEILHRPSFFQERANALGSGAFTREFLQPSTGMTERTLANGTTISTQDTPEYRLTRYVRKGDFVGLYLTTSKATAVTFHRAYQRLYLYDTDKPLTHQYFMPFNDNDAYVYKNGLVLGNALTNSDDVNLSKTTTAGERNMFIKLSLLGRLPTNEDQVTIACDFCYDKVGDNYRNDLSYANGSATTAKEGGDLTEPTLSLRQIWTLIDAKVMANELVTKTGDDWLEKRTIHFSNKTQGLKRTDDNKPLKEYVPLANDLENYWIYKNYTGDESQRTDENLVQVGRGATNANSYYVIVTEDHGSGITVDATLPNLPQATSIGDFVTDTEYKRRRQISFSYPESREVPAGSSIDIMVYAVDKDGNQNRYNIAKFTLVFDAGTETLPYMDIVGNEAVYPERSPEALFEQCGKPHAYLNFDYHHEYGLTSPTRIGMDTIMAALPLDYTTTNYAFARRITSNNWDPRIAAGWGTSGVGRIHTTNVNGSAQYKLKSVSDYTGIAYPDDYDRGYLFVDASDLPGQVATVSFAGDFCEGSLLMCSGWIASLDGAWGNHSAGSVILTVMGRKYDEHDNVISEDVVYSFCPGQLPHFARRANGTIIYPKDNKVTNTNGDWIWQQFYFEFYGDGSRDYYLKIDNNATSTEGGDYMLDDIWIFSKLPTIEAGTYLPLCGGEMEVIRLANDYESLLLARAYKEWEEGQQEQTSYIGLAYLDWDKFYPEMKAAAERIDSRTYTDEVFDSLLNAGHFMEDRYATDYRDIFNGALMKTVDENNNEKAAYLNFEWSNRFDSPTKHTPYTFTRFYSNEDPAGTVYYAQEEGKKKLIINGKMNINSFEYYHHYKLLVALLDNKLTDRDIQDFCYHFNVLSTCSKSTMLYMLPFIEIDGEVGKQDLFEYTHCENTIQTIALHLTSYYVDTETGELTLDDNENVYFDWWLGSKDIAGTKENFYLQRSADGTITLENALKSLRYNYPYATTLDDLTVPVTNSNYPDYPLTQEKLDYLNELAFPADGGKPMIHLRSRVANLFLDSSSVKLVQEDDKTYAYLCALPIEKDMDTGQEGVFFSCSEPQPLKVRVGELAPHIDIGFPDKAYPNELGLLSVRIAKKQFEQVNERNDGFTRLHIPIRNVSVPSDNAVGIKILDTRANEEDVNHGNVILLTSTDDTEMEQFLLGNYLSLDGAKVGTITYLNGTLGNTEDKPSEALAFYFNSNFKVREGYSYTLKFPFTERIEGEVSTRCEGYSAFVVRIVPDYEVWTGAAGNTDWSNDDNWRRADYDELYAANGTTLKDTYLRNGHVKNDGTIDEDASNPDGTPKVNYITAEDRRKRRGYAPLYCTNILMMTDETAPPSVLYDDGDEEIDGVKTGFPALRNTSSPLIRYDFQGHSWPIDEDDEMNNAEDPDNAGTMVRQEGDIITELYTSNVCDGIVFQPETELLHAELLNYEKAWVEFALDKNKWHLVGSPLKNTISGEWYSPTWSARQETTYYEPVQFDLTHGLSINNYADTPYMLGYDRFAPAVYQRAWDKAKAVLYERGAEWSAADGDQTDTNTGDPGMGQWTGQGNGFVWQQDLNASDYLNRLTYKPMGPSKVNVAVSGTWSGAYNDHTVPYDGGFSIMPINHFKEHNDEAKQAVFRMPKEDYFYDIWDWGKTYSVDRRVRVFIKDENNPWPTDASWFNSITETNTVELNYRGRLRSDDLRLDEPTTEVPVPQPKEYTVTLKNEGQGSVGFFLACNPFICGLDMQKFFAKNTNLAPYYLVLKDSEIATDEELTPTEWKWTDVIVNGSSGSDSFSGLKVVPARRGFFVRAADGGNLNETTVTFTTDMMVAARTASDPSRVERELQSPYLSICAQRNGNVSEARVIVSPDASNTFLPEEDLETFLVSDISSAIPVVYTLTGNLATSINRLRHFNCLPLGVISNSTDPATLTFRGVENVGSDLQLYDAYLQTLTPLANGTSLRVPGSTQNRFYLITSIDEESLADTDIQIRPVSGGVQVTSVGGDPLTQVAAYDMAGRTVAHVDVALSECFLSLPKGAYAIKAETASRHQVKMVIVGQ